MLEELSGYDFVPAPEVGGAAGPVVSPTVSPTTSIHPASAVAEPPIVARLVVEIRADGTTTIARAGLLDEAHQERTVFEARASTPLALAAKLARHLVQLSLDGPRAAARSLLKPGPRRAPPR
ncbi:MAG: hypothetical protein ABJA82_03690 [Myxococcales bacterium]